MARMVKRNKIVIARHNVTELERAASPATRAHVIDDFTRRLRNEKHRCTIAVAGCAAHRTRIVAHDYDFRNWKADEVVEFRGPDRTHTLYMWEVKK